MVTFISLFQNKKLSLLQKTKPDSLTCQGLPGINTAKIVRFYTLNKFDMKKSQQNV